MIKINIFFIVLAFILSGSISFAEQSSYKDISASEARSLSDRAWQQTIAETKNEIQTLLDKNRQLSAEYEILKENLSPLHDTIYDLKREVSRQERETGRLKSIYQSELQDKNPLTQKVAETQNEIAALKSRNLELNNQLSARKEKVDSLQQHLSDLKVKRNALLLELDMQKMLREDIKKQEPGEVDKLSEYEETEAALSAEIKSLEEKEKLLLDEIEMLKNTDVELKNKVGELKKQQESNAKHKDFLAKERERLSSSSPEVPLKLVREKRSLEGKIAVMEKEFDEINQSIAEAASIIEKKRSLMNEIMSMDAENQELREGVAGLMEEVRKLKGAVSKSR